MIFLTGGNGNLGTELQKTFQTHKIPYIAPKKEILNLLEPQKVRDLCKINQISAIWHTAAFTNVNQAEEDPEKAETNIKMAQNLMQTSLPILNISTDYVFDGKNAPYAENAKQKPLNIYGKSKYEAEKALETYKTFWNVRISWLMGEKHNFFIKLDEQLKEKSTLQIVKDQYGKPTFTKALCKWLIQNFYEKKQNFGHFHAVPNGNITNWADLAKKYYQLQKKEVIIEPVTSNFFKNNAKRPKNSELQTTKLPKLPHWEESLATYIKKIQ